MKINLRGRRAYLYRRRWVPAGPDVPHAHPAEDYLGAIDTNAESIPPELLPEMPHVLFEVVPPRGAQQPHLASKRIPLKGLRERWPRNEGLLIESVDQEQECGAVRHRALQ